MVAFGPAASEMAWDGTKGDEPESDPVRRDRNGRARRLARIYVSGAGTDSSERERSMWARVKGETENALLRLPFKAVMFRPAGIVPLHGIVSKTRLYRVAYTLTWPLWSVLLRAFPQYVTTTEQVGRAMIRVAKQGASRRVFETRGDPFESQSLRTNVTFMFTRNSVILPPSIFTFCCWIQALLMFFRVFSARAIPTRRASSKLFVDEAVISVTFATAIAFSLLLPAYPVPNTKAVAKRPLF
jgi:hypothetical protein